MRLDSPLTPTRGGSSVGGMDTRKVRLWLVRETDLARYYSKLPPEREPTAADKVWLPRSQIEHTSKRGNEHVVTIPEWLADKNNL